MSLDNSILLVLLLLVVVVVVVLGLYILWGGRGEGGGRLIR